MADYGGIVNALMGAGKWLGNLAGTATYTRPQDIQAVRQMIPQPVDSALETAFNSPAANDALGVVGMGPAVGAIRAYHGSPYDFDKFDLSKIGTGEGAQAYGHGLYFAEKPEVAQQYRDTLAARPQAVDDPISRAQFWAHMQGGREAGIAHFESVLRQSKKYPQNFDAADLAKTQQAIDYLKSGGDLSTKAGRMYEVNINAEPEQFLDWDKPLSQQPKIAEAINKNAQKLYGVKPWDSSQPLTMTPATMGRDAYLYAGDQPGFKFNRQQTSETMKEAGIPGIKYLDQGSRWTGDSADTIRANLANAQRMLAESPNKEYWRNEIAAHESNLAQATKAQTNNYVVFNPDLIDIIKKYGIAAVPAAGIADAVANYNQGQQ